MDIHGFLWISMDIHSYPWISKDIHGCMDIHGWEYLWISMSTHRYPWVSIEIHVYSWSSQEPPSIMLGATCATKDTLGCILCIRYFARHRKEWKAFWLNVSDDGVRWNSVEAIRNRSPVIFQPSVYYKLSFSWLVMHMLLPVCTMGGPWQQWNNRIINIKINNQRSS